MDRFWSASVPNFLVKLWKIVDDTVVKDVIRWSEDGNSFHIVDEQAFAKEVLPKYFKHNNISSFIRQLHIYGFRKVIAMDSGRSSQDKVPMEFQHPLFKRGEACLLGDIKRKVPTVKTEDVRIYTDKLQRMLTETQELRNKQSNMDAKFAELKKEHAALWLEMTKLRKKYCEQQKLLTQILQFILGLMSGKHKNRKRSLPVISGATAAKCARQYFHIPEEKKKEAVEILKDGYAIIEDKYKILLDRTLPILKDESKSLVSSVDQASRDDRKMDGTGDYYVDEISQVQKDRKDCKGSSQDVLKSEDSLTMELDLAIPYFQELIIKKSFGQETEDISLELVSSPQDRDSILIEDKSDTQYNTIVNRDEMHCTEGNLVELKSLPCRKKVNYDSDLVSESVSCELPTLMTNKIETSLNMDVMSETDNLSLMKIEEGENSPLGANGKKDKQVIQYKKKNLLSLLDDVPISDFAERLQQSNDLLLDDLKNPSNVSPDLGHHDYITLNISSPQEGVANPIENLVPQLCMETSGESNVLPFFFLNPATNFFDEYIEIEPST